jgi:GTP diphosphokinase / guanosine-3',5'-bis(diphosphate) 3'-diphosphatase
MATLERAIALASQAHAGQVDKAGQPYILHPLRVMLAVTGASERMAAVLHDVVEDTAITLDDLRDEGFPKEVIDAIEALTKRPGETRLAAAGRAVVNPIARVVKLADVTDNMDLNRIAEPTEKDYARFQEYKQVRALLLDSKDCDIATPGVSTPG